MKRLIISIFFICFFVCHDQVKAQINVFITHLSKLEARRVEKKIKETNFNISTKYDSLNRYLNKYIEMIDWLNICQSDKTSESIRIMRDENIIVTIDTSVLICDIIKYKDIIILLGLSNDVYWFYLVNNKCKIIDTLCAMPIFSINGSFYIDNCVYHSGEYEPTLKEINIYRNECGDKRKKNIPFNFGYIECIKWVNDNQLYIGYRKKHKKKYCVITIEIR